jgi:hypothetical protein
LSAARFAGAGQDPAPAAELKAAPSRPAPAPPPAGAPSPDREPPPSLSPSPLPGSTEAPRDPDTIRREALFDIAVAALVHGDLAVSERAFAQAADLPGDPVRATVASSFADRVRRLREQRLKSDSFAPPDLTARASRPAPPAERSYRAAFVGVTSVLGVSLYGWALPFALGMDTESPRRILGVYMLTGAASFVGPYLLTRDRPVSAGQANLVLYGGSRGAWHGVMAAALFGGNTIQSHPRAWAASMALGSAAELTGGYLLAGRTRMTAGQARTVAALGDFGLLWGIGAGYFLRFPLRETTDKQARGMAASTLIGSALGLGGGYALARRRDHSWGDAEVLRMAGLLGGLVGFGTADVFDMDIDLADRKVTALAIAGSALGVVAGDRLVRHTELSVSQSFLVDLATIAGSLGATGVAYLATSPDDDGTPVEPPFLMAAALGGTAAFAASYWALHDRPDGPSSRPRRRAGAGPRLGLLPLRGDAGATGAALSGSF